MRQLKIILLLNSLPLIIGFSSQFFYYSYLKKYIVLSFFYNKKDLGIALLAYSIALFGIVATISTIVYGLEKISAKKYLNDFGCYYYSSWLLALIYLVLTAFTSIMLLATSQVEVLIWIIRVTMFLFMVSLIQSLFSMWTGIQLLRKK